MSGTIRTPSTLMTTYLADNSAGDIAAGDVRDFCESAFSIVLSAAGVKTANYTAVLTDRGTIVPFNTSSGTTSANATFTIPAFSSVNFPTGSTLGLLWVSGATVQPAFAAAGGVTIVGTPLTARTAGSLAWAWQYSQDVWYLLGDIG
jgi:hypothetical protein